MAYNIASNDSVIIFCQFFFSKDFKINVESGIIKKRIINIPLTWQIFSNKSLTLKLLNY